MSKIGDIRVRKCAILTWNHPELLRSIENLLSQRDLALASGSPQHQDVMAVTSAAATSLPSCSSADGTAGTSTGARPRVPLSERNQPSTGSYGCGPGKSQGIGSYSSDCDDIQKQKPDTRRFKSNKPLIQHNWREFLPSTSTAGFGDENKPPASKSTKRRPGRPKGSKNKPKLNESSDSGSAEDDPSVLEVFNSDSSDCANAGAQNQPPTRRFKCKPLAQHNWRESLPSTSSGAALPTKRPKGSKNKTKVSATCASETSELTCHICREGKEGGSFCITDCGHLFHKKCLDRWIATSSQKYRTLKTCPYCGSSFQASIPFFG